MWQRSLNKGSEYLIPAYQLFDIGAFATTTYNTGKWVLSGGMRVGNRHLHSFELKDLFDRFSRDFTGVTGSVGAVYNATENMTFRMNVARGFRPEPRRTGIERRSRGNGNVRDWKPQSATGIQLAGRPRMGLYVEDAHNVAGHLHQLYRQLYLHTETRRSKDGWLRHI